MINLRTKTILFSGIAIALLFAAAAGAATLYFHYEYHKHQRIETALKSLQPAPVPTPVVIQTPQVTPIVPVLKPLVQKSVLTVPVTAKKAVIVPKLTPTATLPAAAPIVQDHCINIAGVQATVPDGMSHDSSGNCIHIQTQAEIDAQVEANKAATAAADASAEALRQTQLQGLNKQLADVDLAYSLQDQTNISYFRVWQQKHNQLLAEIAQLQYAPLK